MKSNAEEQALHMVEAMIRFQLYPNPFDPGTDKIVAAAVEDDAAWGYLLKNRKVLEDIYELSFKSRKTWALETRIICYQGKKVFFLEFPV